VTQLLGATSSFVDIESLVVELKMAWIDATNFQPDELEKFITIDATIPAYKADNASQPKTLIPNGSNPGKLALVGMHVVFSAKGHPAMLWATFEQVKNTPNARYHYDLPQAGTDAFQDVASPQEGLWLFSSSRAICDSDANKLRMTFNQGKIKALRKMTIGPSNICRFFPWGGNTNKDNSAIISINKMVHEALSMRDAKDARRYYNLIGVTWTTGGKHPSPNNPNTSNSNHSGTWVLANSTMETFVHDRIGTGNCLVCHRDADEKMLGVSHIWEEINPSLRYPTQRVNRRR